MAPNLQCCPSKQISARQDPGNFLQPHMLPLLKWWRVNYAFQSQHVNKWWEGWGKDQNGSNNVWHLLWMAPNLQCCPSKRISARQDPGNFLRPHTLPLLKWWRVNYAIQSHHVPNPAHCAWPFGRLDHIIPFIPMFLAQHSCNFATGKEDLC